MLIKTILLVHYDTGIRLVTIRSARKSAYFSHQSLLRDLFLLILLRWNHASNLSKITMQKIVAHGYKEGQVRMNFCIPVDLSSLANLLLVALTP